MKTVFKKMGKSNQVYEMKIPESYLERLRGLKAFCFCPAHCALLYRSPCILHTFGFQNSIWILPLDNQLNPTFSCLELKPNSILKSSISSGWVAEFNEKPTLRNQHTNTKQATTIIHFSMSRIRTFWLLAVLILLINLVAFCRASAASPTLKIPVGGGKEVNLSEAPRSLDISQPDVIDVQRIGSSNKILVTALRSGTSRLIAQFHNGQTKQWSVQAGIAASSTEVLPSLSSGSLVRLARELQKRTGLETVMDNGRIVVFGQLQNEIQLQALADLCLGREECLPRFSSSPEGLMAQAKILQAIVQDIGFENIRVIVSTSGILVRGSLETTEQLEQLRSIIKSLVSQFRESVLVAKSGGALIETELTFFRLDRGRLLALGFSTDSKSKTPGQELIRAGLPDLLAQLKNGPRVQMKFPDLLLKALAQKGIVQQIAKPSITVASGGQGEIQTGGEILFQSQGENQKFFTQTFGLSVSLNPKLSANDQILQKLNIKISHPSPQANPSALSEMTQSILNTEVNCKPNEQVLLTKINQQFQTKSVSKIPILGHLPIIGELFKSREINSEDNELWIALRSSIVSLSKGDQAELKDTLESENISPDWLD